MHPLTISTRMCVVIGWCSRTTTPFFELTQLVFYISDVNKSNDVCRVFVIHETDFDFHLVDQDYNIFLPIRQLMQLNLNVILEARFSLNVVRIISRSVCSDGRLMKSEVHIAC